MRLTRTIELDRLCKAFFEVLQATLQRVEHICKEMRYEANLTSRSLDQVSMLLIVRYTVARTLNGIQMYTRTQHPHMTDRGLAKLSNRNRFPRPFVP